MLWLNDIEKGFGPQALFEDVSWQINPGHRVGLIGPNGVGKSTLMKIITGEVEADRGEVTHIKGMTMGYLPQDVAELTGVTIRQEASKGLEVLWSVQAQIDKIADELTRRGDDQELLERYGALQSRFEEMGGFEGDSRVEQVLCGLGFRADELDQSCDALSGGWLMRVVLSRLLLQRPDVLLLDEPTNHLDLESVGWLKHFLQGFTGSLILISHDRWFLNEICTHVAELSQSGLTLYTGNFDQYLIQVEQRRDLLDRQRQSQARKVVALETFIDRFRYKASKAKQVQSRIKQLDKLQEVGEVEDVATIHFKLPDPPKSGRIVLALEDLDQGYHDDALLYRGLDLMLERGQHLALVGPNGAGKSTLLKIFAGVLRYQRGSRTLGHLVKPYYFAQHQAEELDLKLSVLEEAQSAQEGASITHIRNLLGAFLFDSNDVKKKVAVLSGGEKSRLALVKMLLTPSNLLLLDEPTNHLDMGSRAVLGQALRSYDGTVVLISHDRFFIDEVCDQVWEVKGGRVTPFFGDYSQYLQRVQRGERPAPFPLHGEQIKIENTDHTSTKVQNHRSGATVQSDAQGGGAAQSAGRRKEERKRQSELRQAKSKSLRPLKATLTTAEERVQALETRQAELETIQCDPTHYDDAEAVIKVAQEVKSLQIKLKEAYAQWEGAEEAYAEAEAQFER